MVVGREDNIFFQETGRQGSLPGAFHVAPFTAYGCKTTMPKRSAPGELPVKTCGLDRQVVLDFRSSRFVAFFRGRAKGHLGVYHIAK